MPTLADLTSWIDSTKRRMGSSLADLASDPQEFVAQALARLREDVPQRVTAGAGSNASDIFRRVANPDAVLGSSLANVASGFAPIGMAGVMTYHGTPHKFDSYDLSKIGTGEGAQSYGHGIYFAENPETAKTYQRALSKFEAKGPDGPIATMGKDASVESGALEWIQTGHLLGKKDPIAFAIDNTHGDMQNLLTRWQSQGVKTGPSGKLLKQDLPDEVLPRMLQWDKPLNEQPAQVQSGLIAGLSKASGKQVTPEWIANFGDSGEKLYALVNAWTKHDPKGAAQFLKEQGIPGLSYLDAGSRGAGQGTMNHVVWDQELLNRMRPQVVE